jgi:porphobilinogen synthase
MFPINRPRRLRSSEYIRSLVKENRLTIDDFIYPMFIEDGNNISVPIQALEGQFRYSPDMLDKILIKIKNAGVKGILLFGIPKIKDEIGSEAWNPDGGVQRGIKYIKDKFPELVIFADVCMCEYTSHGHCGIIKDFKVDNDSTLELLGKVSLSYAKSGADFVAPSDMMDGRIGFIRKILDENNYPNVGIMSYSAKYSSAFYGPFREAAGSAPAFGDRRGYQMDTANVREALKESLSDIEEGADIIMVKPALSYLDVIAKVKENTNIPLAAYNVSGEYAMVKALVSAGYADEIKLTLEILTSIKRAGADIILSYHALDVAEWLKNEYK